MTSLRIEHYETVSKLGSGGSAEVYVARDTRTGDHVALKLFTRGTAVDRRRFERECSLLAQLELPSYARHLAHGVWIAEGMETRWLAMEWVQGPTLAQLFKERSLSVHESLELVGKVARAVAELHRRGIVHRDLKPHNVILRGGDLSRPVLLDLGIARVEGEELTQLGALLGTIGYMAPEQVRGEPVDARADVFSLGVLLFRSIAGVMPFAAEEQVSVLLRIAFEVAPRLSSRVPDVPPSVDQVAATLLAHQREDRPEDAGAAATLLEEVVRHLQAAPSERGDDGDRGVVVTGGRSGAPGVPHRRSDGEASLGAQARLPRPRQAGRVGARRAGGPHGAAERVRCDGPRAPLLARRAPGAPHPVRCERRLELGGGLG
jgi:serine/threonine protein kinase